MLICSLRRCHNIKKRVVDTVATFLLNRSVLHKEKSTITQIKYADSMLILRWAIAQSNYDTTQVDCMYWA